MSTALSGKWSQDLARSLGERHGRTFSGVVADGLSRASGGGLPREQAKELVHAGMGAGLLHVVASPKPAAALVPIGLAALTLWALGQSNR